ncbi:MAG: ABC transporter permease [Bacteroidetes bacterium]|nr:MAG: ABC transporter permease [Bacteroidota bacterium]
MAQRPAQIAWRRFRRHGPAMAGLVYATVCVLVAILGYLISPDHTTHANLQVLELAKLPPGTQARLLMVPQPDVPAVSWLRRWWQGQPQQFLPIPLDDASGLVIRGDFLCFVNRQGQADSVRLSRFGAGPYRLQALEDTRVERRRFVLGTDTYGRDLLSRILLGSRVSLSIGLMAVLLSLAIGLFMGSLAGYFGGWVDQVIMWLVSVMWSIPTLLMALAISFVLGRGFWQLFVAIGISMWVEVARIVRGQMMSLREQPFTEAARALGFRAWRIMFRHVLPNVTSPIIVIAVANFGAAVLIESGLSFLGIGVEVPIPTWGRMIYEGYTYIVFENGKWLAFFPGLALIMLIVSINLIGIGLRDALDVKLANR